LFQQKAICQGLLALKGNLEIELKNE